MQLEPQHWWAILGIAFIIIEIFSPSFFAASLAVGAFASALAAMFGTSLEWQLVWFSFVSVISIFFVRPLAKKYLYNSDGAQTNADALIGRECKVIAPIKDSHSYGKVAIDGDEWQITSDENHVPVKAGAMVKVVKRDSIILTVEPIK